ncbi:hypothetical protein SAMN04487779_1002229 [Belnapia rosea]|uniref:Uncharacterized protein n=1 Tax=Belnapia rosea TaxID=938405 RepID=A0A1G6P0M7_9PROT|nr:hypothetical protein SAMN04487779_1002229 [Belnapia rosea]
MPDTKYCMTIPSSHPHVVRLPISRGVLGDARFERTFQAVRYAAHRFSGHDCYIEAIYEDHQRVGYRFGFRAGINVLRLALYHEAVVQGRPFPLKGWAAR